MLRKAFLLVLLGIAGTALSQNSLDGSVHSLGRIKVYLLSLYGEKTHITDSTISDTLGNMHFRLSANLAPGLYKVSWGKTGYVNLILNKEDVSFETWANTPSDSLKILRSKENSLYKLLSARSRIKQSKLELLMPLVDFYPVKDAFYASAASEFEKTQKDGLAFLDSVSASNPGSYAVRMQRVLETPFISASLPTSSRMEFLKARFWDQVDFKDTALLRSNVFADKIISYLSVYQNNRLTQKQLEAEFIKAVTIALSAASVCPETYKFMLDYLVGGFDKYHFDEVIQYIADNFQDPFSCEDATRKSALQKKLDNFKKLSIGKTAPEIGVPDLKGNIISLTSLASEYTLLVFYSTNCPHCTDMMPKLKSWYDKQKPRRLEVMAVSVDTSRNEWSSFVKKEKLSWINVSELKGFGGKAEDEYNIYATPTMFLLDRNKKILAKPISWRELEQALNQNVTTSAVK
jgi:peroxiredoxin